MLEYSLFERLPFRSQTESLAKEGIVLAQRKHNSWTVTLYSLDNAFVELWSGEKAQVISTFKKTASAVAILEPYINELHIEDSLDFDR